MPLYQPIIPTRYAQPLIALLSGMDASLLLGLREDTGIDAARLCSPDAELTMAEFDVLMQALHRRTGRSDLGFELGNGITLASHGLLGAAMARCRTVGEVLSLGARFTRLMSPSFTLRYRADADAHTLVWQPAAGMSSFTLHAFYEIHIVSLYRLLESLAGPRLPPFETRLPIPRPPHAARYDSLPKLKVQFAAAELPAVRTRIPASLAALPMAWGAEGDSPSLEDLQRLQASFPPARQWRSWVELMLRECEGCQPTQAELAELLNVSAHTLARRLREEGCGFRELAGEIRHQRALAMLREGRYTVEQAAARLGYAHVSNFSHAFSRAEGESPRASRRRG